MLEGYERSKLTRRDYCAQMGIPVTTFDYYRRRQAGNKQARKPAAALALVKVIQPERSHGFALVLSNGRRIESGWGFASEELTRLVRVVEQA